MAARRETIVTLGPTTVSRILGPIETRQTSVCHFTIQYTTTAVTLTGTTVTLRTSNVGRANPASPVIPPAPFFATNPTQTGFDPGVANANLLAGNVVLNAAAAGTYEQTFGIIDFGQFIWFDYVYGSGGGTVTLSIQAAAWSA